MAYVAPTTRATGDLITAAIWNQDVVDNMIAVKALVDGAPNALVRYTNTTDYIRSSPNATFTDIDATNLSFTITPETNMLLLMLGAERMGTTGGGAGHGIVLGYDKDGAADVRIGEFLHNSVTTLYGGGSCIALISCTAGVSTTIKLTWAASSLSSELVLNHPAVTIMDVGTS